MKNKTTSSVGKVLGGVVGVAALSAAAYVLFGPEGKKNRKQIRGWAVKMKGEIIEKFEDAKEITEPVFNQIVAEVAEKYRTAKGVSEDELKAVVTDLHKHWKTLVRDAKGSSKKAKKVAKKTVKKVTKKVVSKKAKK
jgi:gas vesicle protein